MAIQSLTPILGQSVQKCTLDFTQVIPKEIVSEIFAGLNRDDLASCCQVSRTWKLLASDPILWKRHEEPMAAFFTVIDRATWTTYVDLDEHELSLEDAPILYPRAGIQALERLLPKVEENAGVTLLLIPKGLTINKLLGLTESPKKGNGTLVTIDEGVLQEHRDTPIEKSYWIAITNNIIEGSRSENCSAHRVRGQEVRCDAPHTLESLTLIALSFISKGHRLYNRIGTRCIEEELGFQSIVHFTDNGPCVSDDTNSFGSPFNGIGGVLRCGYTPRRHNSPSPSGVPRKKQMRKCKLMEMSQTGIEGVGHISIDGVSIRVEGMNNSEISELQQKIDLITLSRGNGGRTVLLWYGR